MASTRSSLAEVDRRRQDVLAHVVAHGEVRIDELAGHFGVSLATMHRDLDQLAERRLLRKERGRAAPFPTLTMETATRFRVGVNLAVKEALCAAVADEIRPGSTLVLDDSTTVFPLAARVARTEAVTVVTNSLGVARLFDETPGADVTLLGGRYRGEFGSCVGPEVLRALGRIHADVAVMSAVSVLGGRLFHPIRDYAEIKEAMLDCAERSLLLVDHTKFGKSATHAYSDVARYDRVVTDRGAPAEELAALRRGGVTPEVVDA
ncbi:DeoR/GlpR family DNA-binding transcription regulator [Streptomyces angustmyceticus]|uniref:DeoR/GlpR family DNA-binding transcription regulator n=1 Tax=Streptomyces angustmyceticus TaxID=285578 RepID=UPI0021AFAED7|nr:DeoR/GlpR family DNA-binding transcription regulator [Streptomyces angustmyceticus]